MDPRQLEGVVVYEVLIRQHLLIETRDTHESRSAILLRSFHDAGKMRTGM